MHEGQSNRAPTQPDAAGVILVRPALRDAGLLHLIEPGDCDRCFSMVLGFARGSLEFGGLRWAPLVNLKHLVDVRWDLHYYRVKWVSRSYSDHDNAQSKGSGMHCVHRPV